MVFTGTALAVPLSSGSDFPALEGEQVSTEGIENAAGELDEAAQELAAAAEETAKAKEEAWLADCGSEGRNMQERAGKLSSLSGTENPDYARASPGSPMSRSIERVHITHGVSSTTNRRTQALRRLPILLPVRRSIDMRSIIFEAPMSLSLAVG